MGPTEVDFLETSETLRVVVCRHGRTIALAIGVGLLFFGPARAQAPQDDPIHWAYAAFYGIGRYTVGDTRETYSFGFKPRYQFREAALLEEGQRQLGISLRVPFAIGTHDFNSDDLAGNVRLSNVSTVSVVPGVEIEIPMSNRWQLKPLAHLGWGKETGGGPSAWIYAAGIKSQLEFPATRVGLRLVNSLTYIGYSSSDEHSSDAGNTLPLLTALEFRMPLENTQLGGIPVNILWHVAHTSYLDELGFDQTSAVGNSTDIGSLWELGVGFSRGDQRLRLWKFSLDRVSLVFKTESGGDFTGVSITFSSLFDR